MQWLLAARVTLASNLPKFACGAQTPGQICADKTADGLWLRVEDFRVEVQYMTLKAALSTRLLVSVFVYSLLCYMVSIIEIATRYGICFFFLCGMQLRRVHDLKLGVEV